MKLTEISESIVLLYSPDSQALYPVFDHGLYQYFETKTLHRSQHRCFTFL
mgnify:FL=1